MTSEYPAGAAIQIIRAAIDQDLRDAYESDDGMCGLTKADLPRLVSMNPWTNLLEAIAELDGAAKADMPGHNYWAAIAPELDTVDRFIATRDTDSIDSPSRAQAGTPIRSRPKRQQVGTAHADVEGEYAGFTPELPARTDGRDDPASWS